MEELRRIQNPVSTPQPVGQGSKGKAGKRLRDSFRDIIDREREREDEEEQPTSQTAIAEDSELEPEAEVSEPLSSDPDKGRLIDRRA